MLFLTVLFIALGWAGWLWAWGRDRYIAGSGLGLPPSPFAPAPSSRLAAPIDRRSARRRRREVLVTAGVMTLLSLLLARAWSPLWVVTMMSFAFLIWYGWAVYRLENGGSTELTFDAVQARFGPVVDLDRAPVSAGPAPTRRTA